MDLFRGLFAFVFIIWFVVSGRYSNVEHQETEIK